MEKIQFLVLDAMPEKNQSSWNAMIGGYYQNKQPHEALKLFHELLLNRVLEADEVTIVLVKIYRIVILM